MIFYMIKSFTSVCVFICIEMVDTQREFACQIRRRLGNTLCNFFAQFDGVEDCVKGSFTTERETMNNKVDRLDTLMDSLSSESGAEISEN